MESKEQIGGRVDYYTGLAREYFGKYSNNFKDFVGDEETISLGDSILAEGLSTGYNFSHKDAYPLPGEPGTILYSVYSQRYAHFGEVLARMESFGIADEDTVKFYIRGTKILGDYPDPELVTSTLQMGDGSVAETLESVEGSLAFYPKDGVQAIEIAAFLIRMAPKIQGGYLDPDVRASIDFSELIGDLGFKKAVANIVTLKNGDILTLRQESTINLDNWSSSKITVSEKLHGYLVSKLVKP